MHRWHFNTTERQAHKLLSLKTVDMEYSFSPESRLSLYFCRFISEVHPNAHLPHLHFSIVLVNQELPKNEHPSPRGTVARGFWSRGCWGLRKHATYQQRRYDCEAHKNRSFLHWEFQAHNLTKILPKKKNGTSVFYLAKWLAGSQIWDMQNEVLRK